MSDKTLDEPMTREEFSAALAVCKKLLFENGYRYGTDAAENVAVGYLLAKKHFQVTDLQARVKELEARYRFVPIDEAMKEVDEFLGYWNNGDMHVVGFREDGTIYRPMDKEEWAVPDLGMMLPEPPHE